MSYWHTNKRLYLCHSVSKREENIPKETKRRRKYTRFGRSRAETWKKNEVPSSSLPRHQSNVIYVTNESPGEVNPREEEEKKNKWEEKMTRGRRRAVNETIHSNSNEFNRNGSITISSFILDLLILMWT